MSFHNLELNSAMLRAVKRAGYTEPTPIQTRAIPQILQGRDLIGCAQNRQRQDSRLCLAHLANAGSGPWPATCARACAGANARTGGANQRRVRQIQP